jgi:hyperosmotically inducible protein
MRFKLAKIALVSAFPIFLAGCANSENYNANANANARVVANANSPAVNANSNANTSTRRAPNREEYERDRDRYQREAKELGRTIGTGINDGWLWTKTRFELAAADDLRDSTINVDVNNDVVTLTGTVANAAQKAKAESIAKAVEGVKAVKNLLKVSLSGNANTAAANSNQSGKPSAKKPK